jgi:non-homologous end joining protein Ku
MGEFFQETIDNHRATFDPSNIRDLIDTYLAEIQSEKEEGRGESLFEGRDHGENYSYLNTFCNNWINSGTCKIRYNLCLR